jgi:hypothetical protein
MESPWRQLWTSLSKSTLTLPLCQLDLLRALSCVFDDEYNENCAIKSIEATEIQLIVLIRMKITGVSVCLLLLLSFASCEALQLYSVSSSPTQVLPPSGSVSGGTVIYLRGLGFSTNPGDNQVMVGPYPCVIPADGATATTLACYTSDTQQTGNIYYLPITVTSNGQQQQLTNEQGSFSYLYSSSPLILHLFPASAVPGTLLHFYGIHRITNLGDGLRDMGDVVSMQVGSTQCGRFDILEGPIAASSPATISCHQASQQEAGKYSVAEYVTPGKSLPSFFLRRTSFLSEYFNFAVLPAVQSVTPASGTYSGQTITITGAGFSTNASVVKVSVNGTVCDVASSTLGQIVCRLRQKQASDNAQLSTDSGSQVSGFVSGSGLKYSRYSIGNLSSKTPTDLRNAILSNSSQIALVESGYRGEIESGDYYGSYYGQAFTGYFTAPADGRYGFQGVADDSFAVFLASPYGSAEPAVAPLIYSDSVQNSNYYLSYKASGDANVTLQAGKSYYMEVYHINLGGTGFLRVSAQVPNTDASLLWQTHAVHRLDLTFTNDPEVVQFNQTGGTGGSINLTVITRVIGKPPTVEWGVISFNADIASFLAVLQKFTIFSSYNIYGQMAMYDSNGALTPNASEAHTYSWTVTVPLLRPSAASTTSFTPIFLNYTGAQLFSQAVLHPHGPLIAGTFTLSLGGNPIALSGNAALSAGISAGNLQSAFQSVAGMEQVQVNLISSSSLQAYGASWVISYYGVNTALPDLTLNFGQLTGGLAGTTPQMAASTMRYYSPSLLFDPIDYQLLRTHAPQPNVLVTVNSLPSVCTGACAYAFLSNTPVVASATLSGPTLTLSLTDPSNLGYSLADVTVSLGGQPCAIVSTANPISSFQCQLPANPDGTACMPAGSYMPVVTVSQVGQLSALPAVVPLDFSLVLTSLNFTSGADNGGYDLKLTGAGFPLSIAGAKVSICGVEATILSISNTEAEIIVPGCAIGSEPVTISNLVLTSNALAYDYLAGTPAGFIFSVSPQSANPTLKGIMEITGQGFGTDSSAIRVDLANGSGKVYAMRILELNDTYIRTGIPGGLAGQYEVEVNKAGVGEILPSPSSANDFSYELVVTSVAAARAGSYHGGTLLHIQGLNFSPALDETLVYVGNELNWFCQLESLNATDAFCRTPPASPYYNISLPQPVYMECRLMYVATCPSNNC